MKYKFLLLAFPATLILAMGCSFPKYEVKYEVTCTRCDVSYLKEKDEYVQRESATGTWTYSFRAYENQSLSVAAQNVDTLKDKVFVSISINGEVVDSISRSGKPWSGAIAKHTAGAE